MKHTVIDIDVRLIKMSMRIAMYNLRWYYTCTPEEYNLVSIARPDFIEWFQRWINTDRLQ